MTPQEVQERLKLNQLKDKIWYVVPTVAPEQQGLFEGLVSQCIYVNAIAADHEPGLAIKQCQDAASAASSMRL